MPLGLSIAPGPGAYKDQHAATSPKAPQFTMSAKIEEHTNSYPGPGSYNGDKQYSRMKFITAPTYSLGAKGPSSLTHNANPGPGTYKAKQVMGDAPRTVIASRTKLAEGTFKQAPGPGAYNATSSDVTQQRAPKISMGGVNKKSETDSTPGPGTYKNPASVGDGKNGYSFKQKPAEHYDSNPGPGAYNHSKKTKVMGSGGPKYSMRLKTEVPYGGCVTPGPGTYNADRAYKGGTKKTFGTKGYVIPSTVPGPGSYNPKLRGKKGKSFPRDTRGGMSRAKTPGPGAYKVLRKSFSTGGFGFNGRPGTSYSTGTPGAGTYNPKLKTRISRAPAFSMRARSTSNEKGGTPGPGAYSYKPLRAPSKTMGSRLAIRMDSTPGPGSYSQSYNSISMGMKKKKGKTMGMRNPGSDTTFVSSSTIKSFTMKPAPARPSTSA